LKKEINLPLHILYILCLTIFTFSICLAFFLFSFDTLLRYFNYPLVDTFTLSPFFPAFCGSTLACILPPLFLIGMMRSYEFQERFMRMVEVQSFFFVFLVIIFSVFMYYTVQLEDNMRAIMNVHYFSAISRICMCFYFYLSIKVCIRAQDMPLFLQDRLSPLCSVGDGDGLTIDKLAKNKIEETAQQVENKKSLSIQRQEIWKKYQGEIPHVLNRTINFAQLMGFLLVSLTFFPLQGMPHATFVLSYSFLSVFFLYFYLLYQMKKRPYAVWRIAYVCLNLYVIIFYGLNESIFWQIILLLFFLCQCFVFYSIFWKNKTWFIS